MQREGEKKRPRQFTRERTKENEKENERERERENGNVSAPANSLSVPHLTSRGHSRTFALIHHAFDRSLSKREKTSSFSGFRDHRGTRASPRRRRRRRRTKTTKSTTHFVRLEPLFLVRVSRDRSHASDDGLRCRSDGRLRGRRRQSRSEKAPEEQHSVSVSSSSFREARDVLGLRFDRLVRRREQSRRIALMMSGHDFLYDDDAR